MAECTDCGVALTYLNSMPNDRCNKCHGILLKNSIKKNFSAGESTEQLAADQPPSNETALKSQHSVRDPMQYLKEQQEIIKERQEIKSIILTTETAPNLTITKRIDVISAQAAFEINNFKDLFVGFMNPVKGRSNELEKQLDELRVRSTQNLKAKAHEIGANAIVAVDLDLSTVTIGGISMMMMMAQCVRDVVRCSIFL